MDTAGRYERLLSSRHVDARDVADWPLADGCFVVGSPSEHQPALLCRDDRPQFNRRPLRPRHEVHCYCPRCRPWRVMPNPFGIALRRPASQLTAGMTQPVAVLCCGIGGRIWTFASARHRGHRTRSGSRVSPLPGAIRRCKSSPRQRSQRGQKQCNCTRLVPLPHNPDRAPHDARSAEVRSSQQRGCAGSARPGITAAREEFPWIR